MIHRPLLCFVPQQRKEPAGTPATRGGRQIHIPHRCRAQAARRQRAPAPGTGTGNAPHPQSRQTCKPRAWARGSSMGHTPVLVNKMFHSHYACFSSARLQSENRKTVCTLVQLHASAVYTSLPGSGLDRYLNGVDTQGLNALQPVPPVCRMHPLVVDTAGLRGSSCNLLLACGP